ncbi:MAG TPA: ABC transporter ATP-binding protein [Tissierellales bacterium]|nr:ABC transporter ATP-binding protein [Tissierellales bacterium]
MDYLKKYIKMYWKSYVLALIFITLEAIADLMQPTIMAKIVDRGVAENNLNYVLHMGGVMLGITAIGAIAAVIRNIIASIVSQKFGAQLREDLFIKIQNFSFENIDNFEEGSLITRLTNDVTQLQNFAHGSMRIFIKAPILGIGSIVMAIIINPSMSLILIGTIPVISAIIFLNMKAGYPLFMKMQKAIDKINGVMREYLRGVRVVKAFNRFDYEVENFDDANKNLANISIKGMRRIAILAPIVSFIVNIAIVLVLWFGGFKVNKGTAKVGEIIALTNYMAQILFSLIMISHVFVMFVRAKASAERIGEVFEEENRLMVKDVSTKVGEYRGKIGFENVNFSYGESSEPVLKNINFTCNPGETVAIIGSTGSGKSSLVKLIPRFYDVDEGSIKVDGVDIRDIDIEELRDIIGIVPQKSVLFSGTIRENIRWSDGDIPMSEVEKAAKIAQAHEFITSFPEGYDTILGQGGVNLSGGQKQRISIARALVKKPNILILDDSTSAVDVTTEGEIRRELKKYLVDTTSITIAQRITSVMGADKIVVLDSDGSIESIGIHEELMEKSSIYQDIYRSQVGKAGDLSG